MTLTIELAAVVLLVLLNAFFVAAEYGLVTARRTRILELQHQGSRRARAVLKIVADPPRFIAAMQLGVTLTSLAIGALGEHALSKVLDPIMATLLAVILAFFVITFLHVVIGELVPKGIALGHSETTALAVSAPVRAFFTVFGPLIWFLQRSTELVLRAIGLDAVGGESDVHSGGRATHARLAVDRARRDRGAGAGDALQGLRLRRQGGLGRDGPAARGRRALDRPAARGGLEAVMDSPFTRYPVYRGSLDEILGVLHIRDLFLALRDRGMSEVKIEEIIRPAHMVPETKDLAALLTEFRRTNQHMAIVIDEYGAMEGIVTLEDLLEEIVGEIEDEFDLPDESIEQVDEHTIRIDGTFPIDDFNEQFKTGLPVEDYHTMAGFVFGQLGRAPEPGDTVSHDGMRFDVIEVEGSRIGRIEVIFEQRRDLRERNEADDAVEAQDPGAAA